MLGAREARAGCFADETVVRLVEGDLDEASRASVHEHMAHCDECRRLVAQVARSLGEQDEAEDPEPSLPSAVSLSGLPPGLVIGRYQLIEQIGAGGTGIIYRAHDPQLKRDVAVKLLRPDLTHATGNAQARLLREAQAMARLSHPNVVSVYDAGVFEGQVFVAMELVEGQTLKQWLASGPRDAARVIEMFTAAARGLEAAHAAGLVHRDFKPTNVLVGRDGRPRVTDFGLARNVALPPHASRDRAQDRNATLTSTAPEQTMTLTGTLVGTPAYMAPEQFLGAPTDARSDQFSFCVALYEALYGKRPFAGETLSEIASSVVGGKLERSSSARVPQTISRALLRGLQSTPADRFASMSELIAALSLAPGVDRAARKPGWSWRLPALLGVLALSGLGLLIAFSSPTTPSRTALHHTLRASQTNAIRAVLAAQTPPPAPKARPKRFAAVKQRAPSKPAADPKPSADAPVAKPGRELIRNPWESVP